MFNFILLTFVALLGSGLGCYLYDELVCWKAIKTKTIKVQLFEGQTHSFVSVLNKKSNEIINVYFDKDGAYSVKYARSRES